MICEKCRLENCDPLARRHPEGYVYYETGPGEYLIHVFDKGVPAVSSDCIPCFFIKRIVKGDIREMARKAQGESLGLATTPIDYLAQFLWNL